MLCNFLFSCCIPSGKKKKKVKKKKVQFLTMPKPQRVLLGSETLLSPCCNVVVPQVWSGQAWHRKTHLHKLSRRCKWTLKCQSVISLYPVDPIYSSVSPQNHTRPNAHASRNHRDFRASRNLVESPSTDRPWTERVYRASDLWQSLAIISDDGLLCDQT